MKKLVALAGLFALGLAGVAEAAKPEGAGKKPGGGSPTPSVTYVVSPLVEDGAEVSGSSGRINSRGNWEVATTISPGSGTYSVCLGAELAPVGVPNPLFLGSEGAGDGGALYAVGNIGVINEGAWLGPTFQIYEGGGPDCSGTPIQESGIALAEDGSGLSQFSSPLVDFDCAEASDGDCDVESTALINSTGDWYLATKGLERRTRYDICLVGLLNGVLKTIGLSDKKSTASGDFYAKGNAVGRGGEGPWRELGFQIRKENESNENCVDPDDIVDNPIVLETGIGITIVISE